MECGKLESFKMLEKVGDSLIHFLVTVDFDQYHMFTTYDELNSMVGQKVLFDVRTDVINGRVENVIANVTRPNVVHTIDALDNVRLLPTNSDNRCVVNMDIDSFSMGEYQAGCIAYMSGYKVGRSNSAAWYDCTMIDKHSKVFVLKLFLKRGDNFSATEGIVKGLVGRYIAFDAVLTKFGFQTEEIKLHDVEVVPPPEVEISKNRVLKVLEEDLELKAYVESLGLIETLAKEIDYEPGYHLVRIAMELSIIDTLANISDEYNIKVLRRAAIASRACYLPTNNAYSKPVINVIKAVSKGFNKDVELMNILDVFSDEPISKNKAVFIEVSKFVDKLIKDKRGELVTGQDVRLIDELQLRDRVGALV